MIGDNRRRKVPEPNKPANNIIKQNTRPGQNLGDPRTGTQDDGTPAIGQTPRNQPGKDAIKARNGEQTALQSWRIDRLTKPTIRFAKEIETQNENQRQMQREKVPHVGKTDLASRYENAGGRSKEDARKLRRQNVEAFNLEKCFRTTFALLVLHMWLCLARLKAEGKEGVEFGQYLYEIYNHDLELRVSAAGVNLLLTRWMKDLEKIFYGNVAAYDAAMLPEAAKDELSRVIWRNVFSDEETPLPSGSSAAAVQALARYIRREHACLALTDKEALFSGNLMFSSLHKPSNQGTPLQS